MRGYFANLDFENAYSPTGANLQQSIKLPEHPRVEEKPVLQWTGYDLDVVKLKFRWDYYHTDPAGKIARAQEILASHEPYPLVTVTVVKGTVYGLPYGSNDVFAREYVMKDLSTDVVLCDHSGRIRVAEMSATLIECVQDAAAGGIGFGGGGGFLGAVAGFVSGLFG
jgi:hypothetical protein